MEQTELQHLVESLRVSGTDSTSIEVKASAQKLSASLRETLSAFANGQGGTIILGLTEADDFSPTPGFHPRKIRDALAGMCNDDLTPPIRAQIDIVPFEDASVVVAQIPGLAPHDKPCFVTSKGKYGGSYIRAGDGDRHLTHYEIDRLLENRSQPQWDREIVPNATLEDLDPELVQELLAKERQHAPRIFGKKPDVEALKSLQVIGEGPDGELHPRLGGLLALGIYPQQFFPRLTVTFAAYPGSDKTSAPSGQRFLDSATLAGPIPYLVEDAVARVVANMRMGGMVRGALRKDLPDYPPVAVREAVTNALMHRDYSPLARGSQVQVNMYVDRLEIVNPGGLYGPVTIASLTAGNAIPGSRNETLSRLLESTRYSGGGYVAENRGSGYQEIERELERDMLPPPKPVDHPTHFALTFFRRVMTDAERGAAAGVPSGERIVDYLHTHPTATSRELAAAAGIGLGGARKVINRLIDEGKIERTEPIRSPKQRYRLTHRDVPKN